MFTNPRKKKHFKRKIIYILLLVAVVCAGFFLNTFFNSRKPLYISPIGKVNTDKEYVEKVLKRNNILFSDVILSDSSFLVNIQNNGQVKFSRNKDIDKQISSLQRILIQLTIKGESFKSIDFRFSEPIISF